MKCAKELQAIKKARRRDLLTGRYDKRNLYIAEELFNGKEDDYDITKAKGDLINNFNSPDVNNDTSSSTINESTSGNHNNYLNSIPYENFFSGKWVIPKSIAEHIIHSLCEKNDKEQKRQFIIDVAKYWSLKRESRGGASLLKRLHIEPWSAYSTSYIKNGKKKLKTLEVLATIRSNLEKMRTMTKMIEMRERRKLLITKIQKRIIEIIHFPISAMVRPIFNDIKKNDREEYFWFPVNQKEVEDYYNIIKHPMSFDIIEKRINTHQYKSVKAFKSDMDQIWANAMLYNKEDTHYYITAVKLKNRINRIIKPVFEEEKRLFFNQKIKALRVNLPKNFWRIEFGLSEPIGRFDVIDVNVVDQIEFENKTSEGKDDQKIEGTLNNQFSVEVLSSIEVSKSDDIAITENPMSNLSQGSNIDKKPTKDLINSDQEKKDHSLNKEIKENMESSVSTENRTVLDKNSHSNSNDLNKPSNNEYSLLENKEENNESTASKLQSIPLDESDNKEIITHKLQEILSEENDKSSIPKLQEITSEFSDTMNQNITVENNDKNSLESLAVVKNTSMSEEVIKNKGKKENTTLKENSQIKNALSKIRNNQLSIKKNDININNNNLTNEKLPVSKINKKIDQEKAQNESVDDSRNDETNNNSIIDIDATELNESTVENISHLDEEVINNPDLLSDENKNEKEIKNDDKKNKNTMEDHHLLSRDSTLIDVNIAIAKSDTSLKENNFIKGKANKELQASKMENKQENKNEIIETIIVDDAEKNNDNEKNDSIEISEKNDTIKPKLISKESGLTDSLEKTTKKTHVGRKLKTRSKGKSENGKEDASSIPISKPSKNENNDKVTDDPTDNKDNKDGISQMEESKETLPVLRKSKRFRKKKNNEPIVNVIDETNNKESNDFNSSNTLNKSNDNDGNGPVHMQKRKFEDRDLVQGYLDENNQYHETEELKARYRELERELKESEILDDTSDISVNLPDENESLGSLSISDGDEHFLNIYSLTKNDDLDSEFTSLFHKINKDAHQTINSINKEQQQTGERKTRSKTKANKKLTEKESIEFDMNSTMTSSSSYEIIDIDDVESDQELSYTDKSQQLQKKKENEESDFEKFLKVYSRNKNLALRINMKEQEEEKSKAKGELEKKDSQKSKKDNKEKGDGNQDGKVIQKPARKRGRPPLRSSPAKKLRSSSRLNNENTSKVKSFKNDSSDKDNKNDVIKIPPDNKDATEIPPPNNDTIVEQQPPVNISIIEIPPDDEDDTKIPSNNDDVIEILPSNNEAIKKSFNNNRRNKRKEKNTRNDNINKLDSTPLDNTLNSSNMVTKGRGRKKKTKTEEIVGNNNEKEEDVSESQAIDEYKRITRSSSRSKNSSASTSRNSSRSNSQKSSQSNSPIICQSNKEQSLPTILEDENVDSLEENKDTYSLRTRHTIKKGVKNNNENNNSNNNNNNTTSSTESSQSNPNKRKSDEAKQETDKIYPSKRANNTKSNSDIITSPTSSTSSSSSNRVRHKRILPKSSGPSSTTKTKEIIISENELLFRKNKAVKQFRKRIDESNKLFSSNELDDDKDWISFLKYECGADIISDHLTNKNHKKRGWYWKRI